MSLKMNFQIERTLTAQLAFPDLPIKHPNVLDFGFRFTDRIEIPEFPLWYVTACNTAVTKSTASTYFQYVTRLDVDIIVIAGHIILHPGAGLASSLHVCPLSRDGDLAFHHAGGGTRLLRFSHMRDIPSILEISDKNSQVVLRELKFLLDYLPNVIVENEL